MRQRRACALILLLGAGTQVVGGAVRGPVLDGWRSLSAGGTPPETSSPADLAALLTGGCALLLVVAWLWLVAAVGACTWEALRAASAADQEARSSLFRPRLVRAVVTGFLGATAFAGPPAHAQAPVGRVHALPDDLRAAAVTPVPRTLRLLDGLPVPDRVAGAPRRASPDIHRSAQRTVRLPQPHSVGRRLEVAPGDSLWSLTAGLLPARAPASTIATGWRLLYAANREVVGGDPDLLRPGQALLIDPALAAFVRAGHADTAPRAVQPRTVRPSTVQPRAARPLSDTGGSR